MLKKIWLYVKLIRPVNFVISFVTIIVAGLISNVDYINIYSLIIAALAGALTGAAGNVINDYFDYEIDLINRPDRVLPSGYLSKNDALIFYFFLLFVIAILTINLNVISVIIVIVANVAIFFYSYGLKGVVLIGNLVVSFFTGMAFIFGGAAVGSVKMTIIPAIFAFIINFIREVVKDSEDADGDYKNGVFTFPVLFGLSATIKLLVASSLLLILLTPLPYLIGIYKIEYFIIIMTVFNPLLIYAIKIYIENPDIKTYSKVSKLLKILMVIGIVSIIVGY
jgi:geranylgeranylglycerol-phosphate geranylgeranyltransferase